MSKVLHSFVASAVGGRLIVMTLFVLLLNVNASVGVGLRQNSVRAEETSFQQVDVFGESVSPIRPEDQSRVRARSSWPPWLRYGVWALIGFAGASAIGMALNRRPLGTPFAVLLIAIALWSAYGAWRSEESVWPPLMSLAIMALTAGAGRKANRDVLEKNSWLQ